MAMQLAGAAGAYFAWRHHHPHEAEDMSAVWGAAWRAGGRAALQDSAHLVDLAPLLRRPGMIRHLAAAEFGAGVFFDPVDPLAAAAQLQTATGPP